MESSTQGTREKKVWFEFEPLDYDDFTKKGDREKLAQALEDSLSILTLNRRFGFDDSEVWRTKALVEKHKLHTDRQRFIKKVFIMPDQHVPYHDRDVWSIQMQVIRHLKPDIFVQLGDFEDCHSLSAWDKDKRKEGDSRMRKREVIEVNKKKIELEKLLGPACLKIIHEGNHEERARRFTDKYDKLRGMLEIFEVLDWDDWRVYKYKELSRIGNLEFTHDLYSGKYSTFKSVDKLLNDIMYGHTHASQMFTRAAGRRTTFRGITAGCGIDFDAADDMYVGNNVTGWVHSFQVADMDILKGKWNYMEHRVEDGELIAYNRVWKA